MGSGKWNREKYEEYSRMAGRKLSSRGAVDMSGIRNARQMYRAAGPDPALSPFRVIRECCDSEEHPETKPVILALDVTGSMGDSCLRVAGELNPIMTDAFEQYRDIEFMVMGIGDTDTRDRAPIQISQFESDIRIASQLDRIWIEFGGGGNCFESYSAAWYMGLKHTAPDCWKRGKKGTIITMGDEPLNPYLPRTRLNELTGDCLQQDVETEALYREASGYFNIYHLAVNDPGNSYGYYARGIEKSFGSLLGKRFRVTTVEQLPQAIAACLQDSLQNDDMEAVPVQKKVPHILPLAW